MESQFTTQEALLVVDEALRLLATPETFTQGSWKCPVYIEKPKPGSALGFLKRQKVDKEGELMFAYCVEGAINQACLNKLGEDRAIDLGALSGPIVEGDEAGDINIQGGYPTEALSLNALAEKLFSSIVNQVQDDYLEDDQGQPTDWRRAQMVNDYKKAGEDHKLAAYERVLRILRAKRASLMRQLGKA